MDLFFSGRALLKEEFQSIYPVEEVENHPKIKKIAAIKKVKGKLTCFRCGNRSLEYFSGHACSCQSSCVYCSVCIQMGKVSSCANFYWMEEVNAIKFEEDRLLTWQGQLSDQQAQGSKDIIASIQAREKRLIWAVTGAGKTEMLFEGIEYALKQGLRVAVVSPRVDVCLELYPRLSAAFQSVHLICLHGQMEQPYAYCPLTIATTHQLLRFKQAFDLLVVDEVDAFPFYNNRLLHFALDQAKKESASVIYLTATPDQLLQEQVKKNQLAASILPARYHGHPLVQAQLKWAGHWSKQLLTQPTRSCVFKKIKALIENKRSFLLFLPRIDWMEAFEKVLREKLSGVEFEAVHSKDPNRHEKVMKMRENKIQFLMTTTILERGVTFKDIDVIVLGADDPIFTESSLVQIAGRVGRHPSYPAVSLFFTTKV